MIQLCPECHGEGNISAPPFIGEIGHHLGIITGAYKCKLCGGRGYVQC